MSLRTKIGIEPAMLAVLMIVFLLPQAVPHAVPGSTFSYWVCGQDLTAELGQFLPTLVR